MNLLASHFQPAEIQQMVDQVQQGLGIAMHRFQPRILAGPALFLHQAFERQDDQAERSPQFVRHVGEEAELHLVEFFFSGAAVLLCLLPPPAHFQPAEIPDGTAKGAQQQQGIEQIRPPGAPERRFYFKRERSRFTPVGAVVRRPDHERILPGFQEGIMGLPQWCRSDRMPLFFESFQPIEILGMGGIGIIQVRKSEADLRFIVFQGSAGLGRTRLPGHFKCGDIGAGAEIGHLHRGRIDDAEARGAAEIQMTVGVTQDGPLEKSAAVHPVLLPVPGRRPGREDAQDVTDGGSPDTAIGVLGDTHDGPKVRCHSGDIIGLERPQSSGLGKPKRAF